MNQDIVKAAETDLNLRKAANHTVMRAMQFVCGKAIGLDEAVPEPILSIFRNGDYLTSE